LPKKKKSDTKEEKIKNRVKEMFKERPTYKDDLEFYKDVVTEHNSALLKIKPTSIIIDKDYSKKKIEQVFPIVEKKASILQIPSDARLFRGLCKILSKIKKSTAQFRTDNTDTDRKNSMFEFLTGGEV
jgi:hypothetical protein